MSWTLTLSRDEAGGRAYDGMLEVVHDLIAEHFPPSCGYECYGTRLGGPLEGHEWTVRRGPFCAELSVHRFVRSYTARAEHPVFELRVVARAGHLHARPNPESFERRVIGWGVAGWGIGSLGLAALLIGSSGLLPGWGLLLLLLLLPALAAWRLGVGDLLASTEPAGALPAAELPAALPSPQITDGQRRWRELVPALWARHDRLRTGAHHLPFRSPGLSLAPRDDPEGRRRSRVAASFTWPRPALAAATEASDRGASPPERTTRRPRP